MPPALSEIGVWAAVEDLLDASHGAVLLLELLLLLLHLARVEIDSGSWSGSPESMGSEGMEPLAARVNKSCDAAGALRM